MTSFQNPEVRTCPGCSAPFLHYPIRTINFSGYEVWSDGAPTAWWGREPLVRWRPTLPYPKKSRPAGGEVIHEREVT